MVKAEVTSEIVDNLKVIDNSPIKSSITHNVEVIDKNLHPLKRS